MRVIQAVRRHPLLLYVFNGLIVLLAYIATANLGYLLASVNPMAPLVWAPTGISIAALLVLGRHYWPVIFFAAVFSTSFYGAPVGVALAIGCGCTLEALIGCVGGIQNSFRKLRDVSDFLIRVVIIGPFVSGTIGVFSLYLNDLITDRQVSFTSISWWVGHATGSIVLAPLLIVLTQRELIPFRWSLKLERFISFVFLATACSFVLGGGLGPLKAYSLQPGLILPILVWITVRYGQRSTVVANFFVFLISVIVAVLRYGTSATAPTVVDDLLYLQAFCGVSSLTALILSAVVSEWKRETESLQVAVHALEDSKALSKSIIQSVMDCIVVTDLQGHIVEFNPAAERAFGHMQEKVTGRDLGDVIVAPASKDVYRRLFGQCLANKNTTAVVQRAELMALRADGVEFPAELSIVDLKAEGLHLFTCYIRNLTEIKQAEEARNRAKAELEQKIWERTEELEKANRVLQKQIEERQKTEEELRQSEERFRLVVEGVKDYAIYMLDLNGFVVSWNQGATRIHGYDPQDIIGQHVSTFYVPEDVETGRPQYELKQAQLHGRYEDEGWCIRKDGQKFWASISVTLLHDDKGGVRGFSKIVRDITEFKLAEDALRRAYFNLEQRIKERTEELARANEALKESERRFRAIFEQAALGISLRGVDGKLIMVNHKFCEIFGYTEDEIKELDISNILHPHDVPLYWRGLERLTRNELQIFSTEERAFCKDGSMVWIRSTISLVRGSSQEARYFISVVEDISARKKFEEEQQVSQKNQTFLVLATGVLNSSLDYRRNLSQVSKLTREHGLATFCTVHLVAQDGGVSRVAVDQHSSKMELVREMGERYPLDPKAPYGPARVIRTGLSETVPSLTDEMLRNYMQDDIHFKMIKELELRSFLSVPLLGRKKILGAVTWAHSNKTYSLADLKLAEELASRMALALDNAHLFEMAQEAIRARDEFLSIASHELKTPITSLKLQLQMTNREVNPERNVVPAPEKLAKAFEISNRQIDRLTNLVEDLLDVSRIQARKLSLNFETFDMSEMVEGLVDRFADHLKAAHCPVEFSAKKKVVGRWDSARVEQVVVNLISNAIKYAAGKPVKIRVEGDDRTATIVVEDFGPGIEKEKQGRIFERFQRANASKNISGLGLGLFIVRKIVRAHGGNIRVESEVNRGTKFIVTLPLYPPYLKKENAFGVDYRTKSIH